MGSQASSKVPIFTVRGKRVVLDSDLAALYGVATRQLNQQVRRNPERFPTDFAFLLSHDEWESLRSQIERGRLAPVHPGEMLLEEFLKPLGITNYRLAKEIGVPAQRIGEIVAGRRSITADTDLRFCRFFGLADGWWLKLQGDYDTRTARIVLAGKLERIRPFKAAG